MFSWVVVPWKKVKYFEQYLKYFSHILLCSFLFHSLPPLFLLFPFWIFHFVYHFFYDFSSYKSIVQLKKISSLGAHSLSIALSFLFYSIHNIVTSCRSHDRRLYTINTNLKIVFFFHIDIRKYLVIQLTNSFFCNSTLKKSTSGYDLKYKKRV